MKLKFTLFCPLIFALLLPLNAEESSSEESNADSEEELPEYSEPPFTVGDRAIIQGYYIPLEEGISLNFRIRSNQMFVYWVDEDDLIIEPQASVGSFRVISTARNWPQSIYEIEALGNEAGIGSVSKSIFKPHIFSGVLSLKKPDGESFDSYNLRYIQEMSDTRETREFVFKGDPLADSYEGKDGINKY